MVLFKSKSSARRNVGRAMLISGAALAILSIWSLSGCTAAQQGSAGAGLTSAGQTAQTFATAAGGNNNPIGAIAGLVAGVLLGLGGLFTGNSTASSAHDVTTNAVNALASSSPPTTTTTTAATATTPAVTTTTPAKTS